MAKKKKDPLEGKIQKGYQLFKKGRYDRAISILRLVLMSPRLPAPRQGPVRWLLAEAHFRSGCQELSVNRQVALLYLEQAARTREEDPLYSYHVGLAHHRGGNSEQALHWYRETISRDPEFKRVVYPLAVLLLETGHAASTDPVWQKLSDEERTRLQHPEDDSHLATGLMAIRDKQPDVAQSLLQAAVGEEAMPELAYYYLGVIAQQQGQPDHALTYWQKAYDAGLRSPQLLSNLVLAYVLQSEAALTAGDLERALNLAEEGLEIEPDHARLQEIAAQVHLERGYDQAERNNWITAVAEWELVEKTSSANARIQAINRAIAYEKLERWYEAAEAWREFARRRPTKQSATGWLPPEQVARLWARISGLYARAGLLDEAISTLQNAVKHQAEDVQLGLALARAYAANEQFEAAHNQVGRVLERDPKNPEVLTFRAELTEAAPLAWYHWHGAEPGIREWKAVLETGDASYAALARQRLGELHQKWFDRQMYWGFNYEQALETARTGLEYAPKNHYLRAMLVRALLELHYPEKDVQQEIDRIDLTDTRAVSLLMDSLLLHEEPEKAIAVMEQAEFGTVAKENLYFALISAAVEHNHFDLADQYLDKMDGQSDESHTKRAVIGMLYEDAGYPERAVQIWRKILREDRTFGPANYMIALYYDERGRADEAKRYIRQAEKWADRHPESGLKNDIERYKLRKELGILPETLYDDDFDDPDEMLNMLLDAGLLGDDSENHDDETVDHEPQTDRRKRRARKRRRNR